MCVDVIELVLDSAAQHDNLGAWQLSGCLAQSSSEAASLVKSWRASQSDVDLSRWAALTTWHSHEIRRLVHLVARSCPNLYVLNLARCERVDDSCLRALGQHCRDLCQIDLEGCDDISDVGLVSLARNCESLRHLYLERCYIGCDELLDGISKYRLFRNLTDLHLNRTDMELDTLIKLIDHATKLEGLDLSDLDDMLADQDDVMRLAAALGALAARSASAGGAPGGLRRLVLTALNGLTPKSLVAIARACPRLVELDVRRVAMYYGCGAGTFWKWIVALHRSASMLPSLTKLVLCTRFGFSNPRIVPSPQVALQQLHPLLKVEVIDLAELHYDGREYVHDHVRFWHKAWDVGPTWPTGQLGATLLDCLAAVP